MEDALFRGFPGYTEILFSGWASELSDQDDKDEEEEEEEEEKPEEKQGDGQRVEQNESTLTEATSAFTEESAEQGPEETEKPMEEKSEEATPIVEVQLDEPLQQTAEAQHEEESKPLDTEVTSNPTITEPLTPQRKPRRLPMREETLIAQAMINSPTSRLRDRKTPVKAVEPAAAAAKRKRTSSTAVGRKTKEQATPKKGKGRPRKGSITHRMLPKEHEEHEEQEHDDHYHPVKILPAYAKKQDSSHNAINQVLIDYVNRPKVSRFFQLFLGHIGNSVTATRQIIARTKASQNQSSVLIEGANGLLLDLDHGTYPYVTSTNTSIGGVISGGSLHPSDLGTIIGVAKAYTTRVGFGPFPTEMFNYPVGLTVNDSALESTALQQIRQDGTEIGTTTGRARRIGWLDLVALKYSCSINGYTRIALTKLDVLNGLADVKICHEYLDTLTGIRYSFMPTDPRILNRVQPLYIKMTGWTSLRPQDEQDMESQQESLEEEGRRKRKKTLKKENQPSQARYETSQDKQSFAGQTKSTQTSSISFIDELPLTAQNYIYEIEKFIEVPIWAVGIGPGRNDIVFHRDRIPVVDLSKNRMLM